MKAFDLEKALAGEKVITCTGTRVSQLSCYEVESDYCIIGVFSGYICKFTAEGKSQEGVSLFMAPKKLSGFINDYAIHAPTWHSTREAADMDFHTKEKRTACIDLSQFEEGHGL